MDHDDVRSGLTERIGGLVMASGVDFWGIADLSPARQAISAQGGDVVSQYPRAISIGLGLLHPIVDLLPCRFERVVALAYRRHCYDLVNQRLDLIASEVSGAVQRAGYRAFPAPASETIDRVRLRGLFSHKMAAHLAGLGWIGKSCLLVTSQVGPRVRWVTVLTDAPLETAPEAMAERCGACRACAEICPVQALAGRPFQPEEPREMRFDAAKCERYLAELTEAQGMPGVCGMCLYACPYGRQASSEGNVA